MARIVVFRGKGPIAVGDPPVSICACGMSKTFPYCSGAHIKVQDEDGGEVYAYDSRGGRLGRVESVRIDGEEIEADHVYSPS